MYEKLVEGASTSEFYYNLDTIFSDGLIFHLVVIEEYDFETDALDGTPPPRAWTGDEPCFVLDKNGVVLAFLVPEFCGETESVSVFI